MLRTLFACLLFFCCGSSVIISAQNVTRDITYITDSSGSPRGDLYQPAGTGPFPAIVFLHGGAWRSGNKSSFRHLASDLANDGYVGFSVNYDLGAHSFPIAWEETRAAVRFLRDHAAEYRVDPNRIVVAGTSAGGELAALAALAPNGPATIGATSSAAPEPVSAAIILNGVFDLCYPVHVIKRYLGGNCAANKALYDDASPMQHIHSNAPPFFVGHGSKDRVVPFAASQVFVRALQEKGVPVTNYRAENGPHMYWEKKSFYAQNLHEIENFLSITLKN